MSHDSLAVYKSWAKSKDLSNELLERIYKKADNAGSVELLTLIADRSNLPENIENNIISRTELDVIKTWVNRNITNTDKIVSKVLADKRATLLLLLSGINNLPESLYKAFAKSTSKKVAFSLALNSSVDDSIIESIDDLVISSVSGEHNGTVSNTSSLLKARPFLLKKFIAQTKSTVALVTAASSFETDNESSIIACKRLSNMSITGVNYMISNAFEKFLARDLPNEALLELKPLSEKTTSGYDYYGRKIIEASGLAISRIGYDSSSVYENLRNSSYQELHNFIRDAKLAMTEKKLSANLVAKAIWENDNSSNSMLLDMLYQVPKDIILWKLLKLESECQLDRVVELFDERISNYTNVDSMKNPAAIVELAASRPGEVALWVKHSKVWENDKYLSLKFQPAIVALTDPRSTILARDLVSANLNQDTQWETFDGLVAEFSGSIYELVDTVKALNI